MGAYFLLIKLYVLKTSHCGWNPEQNTTVHKIRQEYLMYVKLIEII